MLHTSNPSELPEWKRLVYQRIKQVGSIQKVADELGYARPSLSLALRDKYIGSTEKLINTVMKVLGGVCCPHLGKDISSEECVSYKNRDAPTQNPIEMRHWRACQSCPMACNNKKRII